MKKVYYIALVLFVAGFTLIAVGYLLPAVLVLWVSFVAFIIAYCTTRKDSQSKKTKQNPGNSGGHAATTWWYLNNS